MTSSLTKGFVELKLDDGTHEIPKHNRLDSIRKLIMLSVDIKMYLISQQFKIFESN